MHESRSPRTIALLLASLAALVGACGEAPPASAAPVPTAAPVPSAVEIVAEGIELRPARLELPGDVAIQVAFRNRDEGVPHGLVIATRTSGVEPRELGQIEITNGPDLREFLLGPLAPGPYLLSCPVHPSMQVEVDVR